MKHIVKSLLSKFPLIVTVLLAALVFANMAFAAGTIAYGERNNDILQMQKRLKELGYFSDKCTGYFGDVTQKAVSNFQRANGLTATGIADEGTLEKLSSDKAVTKKQYIEYASKGEKVNMTISPGDSGKLVKKLQNSLKQLGYFEEEVTGNYGEVTVYSVKFFQLVNGIPVTGVADSQTLTKLIAPSAIPVGQYETGLILKYGSSGKDVRTLQNYLKELGYYSGECSAKFGKNTQEAVIDFQKCNGLEPTGECDVRMRIMLISEKVLSKQEAEQNEARRTLKQGDRSESVKYVKKQLFNLGYYSGSMDDEFTQALATSIYKFQVANGLKTTKEADAETRALLNSGKSKSLAEYVSEMSVAEVKTGSTGYSVTLLQERLKELGYYKKEINGNFDAATQNAVIYFQRGHQLAETGIADTEMRKLLNSEDALTYSVAEKRYYERKREEEHAKKLKTLTETANSFLSAPYEAGKMGDKSFGNAGFVYRCFQSIGVSLETSVNKQLDSAKKKDAWSNLTRKVQPGSQVFLRLEEEIITGIYVGDEIFIFASPSAGKVIAVENIMGTNDDYVFIGSILYF